MNAAAGKATRERLRLAWLGLAPRERLGLLVAGGVVALALLWGLAVQPAWRTLNRAPAELERLDAEWQGMQRLAAESAALRGAPPVPLPAAQEALRAATARLGEGAELTLQGERVVLRLDGIAPSALRDWLAEARAGARARPVAATLSRHSAGLAGTLELSLAGRCTLNTAIRAARASRGSRVLVVLGVMAGTLLALLVFAPAQWMADTLARATDGRLLLAEARGSLWRGSAVLVLTGGPGSRDASALPGRLHWRLGVDGTALLLRARLACCLDEELALKLQPGLGRLRVSLPGQADAPARPIAQLPLAWLEGLGTPWNTLAPRGTMALSSAGFVAESAAGRWRFSGRLEAELRGAASRLSTLPELGDYRLGLAADAGGGARLELSTRAGALQLSGSGSWAPALRFRGEARAAPGAEAALANLLNIIGRRQGAASLISIG